MIRVTSRLLVNPPYSRSVPKLPEEMTVPDGYLQDGPPAPLKDAATVVLARDRVAENGTAGIEVFLLRRVTGMVFAGGMSVFPGGGVDRRDADSAIDTTAWSGPGPWWWAERFACDPPLARALVCAAVRETFEESGVLLAGPDEHSVVSDATPYSWARQALVDRELSLAEFLADAGLVLRADLLAPWSNWVTPVGEPRRYDTRFFLAALPSGQRADGVTTEADQANWNRPADALEDWKAGERGLLPPTWMTLAEMSEFGSVAEAMASARPMEKIITKLIRQNGVIRAVLPGDEGYEEAHESLDVHP